MAWKKLNLLGAGNYGKVYLAGPVNNPSLKGSLMAVKSTGVGSSSSLQREAKLLQELKGCQYVVQVLGEDFSLEDGRIIYNLLLEYALGGTLNKLIKTYHGAMTESQIAIYSYMLLKGLYSIHDQEIVHCDFKPANILVFPLSGFGGSCILKVADFGLSKKVWEVDSSRSRCTPLYASPEFVLFGLNEKPGDIWAFGCTVVEMITGRPLWSCTGRRNDLFRQIAYGNPRIPENLSKDGKDFLERCLDRNSENRWTAGMLLHHPFITKNLKSSRFGIHLLSQQADLPARTWNSSIGMFSTPLKLQSEKVRKNLPLLPHVLFGQPRNGVQI